MTRLTDKSGWIVARTDGVDLTRCLDGLLYGYT
jgi:hypothetical protein